MHLRLAQAPACESAAGDSFELAPRDAALLAWLALEGATARDRLGALLWPQASAAQARTALRQRLFRLKKQLGRDVAAGSPRLQLVDGVTHDLAQADELLGDLRLPDAPEFDAWLQARRDERSARLREELQQQVQVLESAGRADAALPVAQALLRHDPLSEAAHRGVMRLHYLLGDRAAALLAFDHCEQVLKDEVGTQPSAETRALLTVVETQAASLPALHRAVPAAVLRPPRMVGREREQQQVGQAWAAGHVAAVIGEAGMGKSRLLAECIAQQPAVVRVAARPGDAGVPFATLARLLRAVNQDHPVVGIAGAAQAHLARVLPELGGLPASFVEGQTLQLQLALAHWLRAAPGLDGIVLDDLHFADTATLEMLQPLVAESAPLRWAVAYRPAEAASPLHALQEALSEAARLAPVALAPLDEAALAALVDELDLGVPGEAIAAPLLQRTGGNPLFVLETLKQAWVEQRLDELARGGALPRAMSVERLIDRRIGQLPPATLMLARVAAVAGADFSIELAAAVLDSHALQFADALVALEGANVLRGLQFAHDLVFDAVLRSVPHAIAVHLHAKVAQWLEQHGGVPARVAAHWLAAERRAQAVPWLKAAAEAASRSLRGREALQFLQQAADLEESLGHPEAAFETVAGFFKDEFVTLLPDASATMDQLDRLATSDRQRAIAARRRGDYLAYAWQLADALQHHQRFLALARGIKDVAMIQEAEHCMASTLAMMGKLEEALPRFDRIAAALEANPGLPAPEDFHDNYAVALDRAGRVRDAYAVHLAQHSARQGQAIQAGLAVAWGNRSINRFNAGHMQEAKACAIEGNRIYTELEGNGVSVPRVAMQARAERLSGHWSDALALTERAGTQAATLSIAHRSNVWMAQAECWADLGQVARALATLAQITGASDGVPGATMATAWCETARLQRWRGQPCGEALERARTALQPGVIGRLRTTLELALDEPAEALREATQDVLRESAELGMDGMTQMAWAVRAAGLVQHDPAAAADAARHVLAGLGRHDAPGLYRPWAWLGAVRALDAVGDRAAAAGALHDARAWLDERLRHGDVPAAFRDSFRHRNPVNRELDALAAQWDLAHDFSP